MASKCSSLALISIFPFRIGRCFQASPSCYPWLHLKEADKNLLPMGNLLGKASVKCTVRCTNERSFPLRIAVEPSGNIIFQSCDGVYPSIGSISDPFPMIDARIGKYLKEGFKEVCPYYEEACHNKSTTQKR